MHRTRRDPRDLDRYRRGWRRISTSFWGVADNPQIFGDLEVDARPVEAYLAAVNRRRRAPHVTVTHVAVRCIAHVLAQVPELNCTLRFGRFVPNETIDVFVIVSTREGTDLSGVRLTAVDGLTIPEIAERTSGGASGIRAGRDPLMGTVKRLLDLTPHWALRPAAGLLGLAVNDLGLSIPGTGMVAKPFGGAMVSSIGMLGLSHGYGPLSDMYRVPLFVLVGQVADTPVVEDGVVVARRMLPITVTVDHRYVDGAQLGRAAAAAREFFADPAAFAGS